MYYAEKSDGSKVEFKKLPNAYFLSGYHDKKDAGKLYVSIFDNGTTLTPLYHKSGKTIKMIQYAGKEVNQVGGSDKISKEIESGKFFESMAYESKKISKLPTFEAFVADKPIYTRINESNDPSVESLPMEYNQSGIVMKQIDRSEKAAFYGDEESDTYEVFLIKIADPITDTSGEEPLQIPAREMLPTDDSFGEDAWSFTDRSSALNKFNEFK